MMEIREEGNKEFIIQGELFTISCIIDENNCLCIKKIELRRPIESLEFMVILRNIREYFKRKYNVI